VIENETKYKTYLHGEAVAIGIVMANMTSIELNLMSEDEANRVKRLLEKYSLPTSYEVKNVEKFYEAFYLDKKSSDSSITFILPVGIGGVEITDSCTKDQICSVIEKFGVTR